MAEDLRVIPPKLTPGVWKALCEHGLCKAATCLMSWNAGLTEIEATSGSDGTLLEHSISATAVLLALKNRFKVTGALIHAKAGDYTLTAIFPDEDVSDAILLKGEGKKTRFLPSGAFDALDPTKILMSDLVWRDANGVDHDATLDPNMFENALEQTRAKIHWKKKGAFTERWEQGFIKELYHGRTGPYFESEATSNTPYNNWTPPTILDADNTLEPAPFNDALRMRNSKDGVAVDPLYVGLPFSLHRGALCFFASLPQSGITPDGQYLGFECNSGGGLPAWLACLACFSGQWQLYALDYTSGKLRTETLTLPHPNVWSKYALEYAPPYLRLYEGLAFPLTLVKEMYLGAIQGKGQAFFANEGAAITTFKVGTFFCYEKRDIGAIKRVNARNVPYGEEFVERWNEETFDRSLFIGRSGAFYENETNRDPRTWTTPPLVKGVNPFEAAPFNNAIQMINAIDGVVHDLYIGIPRSYQQCQFTFMAKLPTLAQLTATDHIWVGFEKTASANTCIAALAGANGAYYLYCTFMGPNGPISRSGGVLALTNLNAWSWYTLLLTHTGLRLLEWDWGGPGFVSRGFVEFPDRMAIDWVKPFIANETGNTSILSNFYIGGMWLENYESNPVECSLLTDKDVQFTGGIVQNAKEDENVTGLLSNKIVITDVAIEADEALHFKLLFWATDGFDDANLDLDSFLGAVDVDLTSANAIRIGGAGQYYINVQDLKLHYRDDDYTNELHVSLLNLSAGAKTAGATGEVVLKVGYKIEQ